MKLSVVIVSYNVKYYLEQCLRSLRKACCGVEVEVWVVDNASTDGTVGYLRPRFPEVKWIENAENMGFSRANNMAILQAAGEYVLLLNPDTIVGETVLTGCLRFLEEHPDWTFEPITAANLTECMAMDEQWYQENLGYDGDETLREDGVALRKCMAHYDRMGLEGCLLRAAGRVVAFTMGELMGDPTVYDVHFEKAFAEVQGAYPMVNREFARWVHERHPEVRYLNREDDMGVEGLRKAKESYYPDLMVEKYSACWQG